MKVLMSISAMNQRGLGNPNPNFVCQQLAAARLQILHKIFTAVSLGSIPMEQGCQSPQHQTLHLKVLMKMQ